MNREKLLQLKQENRENPVLYNLIGVIIGECDRVGKDLSEEQIIAVMKKMHKNNVETIDNLIELDDEKHTQKLIDLNIETLFLHQYLPMLHFKNNYKGLYNGTLVSEIARQELNK